jgi:serine/threonine-protein kinase
MMVRMPLEEVGTKRLGTTIRHKWVVEQLIGVGGMASVYVARHKIGRREAIKILHPDIASSEEIRTRFEQEAHAVNAFHHPGAVEVRDIDVTEDGAPFLVMELLEGESVFDRTKHAPTLEVPEIVGIATQTLDVLQAAHEQGIIHRDIKPENLFLTRSGAIKVLDFGIARVRSAARRGMTQAGMMLGTMAYMPPEQARGLEIDPRADLFSVGATLFELLSGRLVHEATTEADLVYKAMSEYAVPLASVAPRAPANICAVIDRALAFDRAARYPDAKTMRSDLEAAGRGEPPPFATAAGALPAEDPSSAMFALRPSFFGDEPGSVAKPRSQAIAAAPDPRTNPTRVERPAPSTPSAGVPVPGPPAASAPPIRSSPTVVSSPNLPPVVPTTVGKPSNGVLPLLIAGGGLLLLVIGLAVVVGLLLRGCSLFETPPGAAGPTSVDGGSLPTASENPGQNGANPSSSDRNQGGGEQKGYDKKKHDDKKRDDEKKGRGHGHGQ